MIRKTFLSLLAGLALLTAGAYAHHTDAKEAVAVIQPTAGSTVHGVVHFTQMDHQVKVVADLSGFAPNSVHGFHIHEFGDVSDPKGMSAGGHFNPMHFAHAGPSNPHRHAGDLGNIDADAKGNAHLELTLDNVSLGGDNSILGRSVVVHKDPDDYKTQPTGNAGARLGVGVIGVAKPAK